MNGTAMRLLVAVLVAAFPLFAAPSARAETVAREVTSLHQAGKTLLRILMPQKIEPGRTYPLVLVLPVAHVANQRQSVERFGDGFLEIQRLDLHNKYNAVFASLSFTEVPWYCDHPTKADVAQEKYLLEVVAEIERRYPVSKNPRDRHLLGFSKSGWGAWAMLLRNPDRFGKAAAFDSPMMMTTIGKWGSDRACGSQVTFDAYMPSKLVRARGRTLGTEPRLILLGYDVFRDDHVRMHALLQELGVPHVYQDGPVRKHHWRTGWVAEAVAELFRR
jgi:Putative esterase